MPRSPGEVRIHTVASGRIWGLSSVPSDESPSQWILCLALGATFLQGQRESEAYPNRVEYQFSVEHPDQVWVSDITQIRTLERWLYLSVVIDLFSRMLIGWSMKPTIHRDIALDSLLMTVWRRRPKQKVIVHSDQGSQFGSDEWRRLMKEHNLEASMSCRGNCYDNAVAESFFSSLKKERTRRKSYQTRKELRTDIFDYIGVFYNRQRRHSYLGQISPEQFEMERFGNL